METLGRGCGRCFDEPVRPDFGTSLCIQQGRHPIMEMVAVSGPGEHDYVPNDTFCNEAGNVHIITGANMVRTAQTGGGPAGNAGMHQPDMCSPGGKGGG